MSRQFDCVVCGEICLDLPVRPIDQQTPLCEMETVRIAPVQPGGGGIVSNSGMALAKLGRAAAAFGYVGDDPWGDILTRLYNDVGLDTTHLLRHATRPTSVTAVLVGEDGEHTFAYHPGASSCFDRELIVGNLPLFEASQFALFGYYALMPDLEDDLPDVLAAIRETGCRTALDAAGGGGTLQPLDRILPQLDIYVPSYKEALSQTGRGDPREMIDCFRQYAPQSLLGVKLGERGALLSPAAGEWLRIDPVTPPGPIVDTTGAGDCFYAGLIAGLSQGHSLPDAGRLAAAAGACSVTGVGAIEGLRGWDETLGLASLATAD